MNSRSVTRQGMIGGKTVQRGVTGRDVSRQDTAGRGIAHGNTARKGSWLHCLALLFPVWLVLFCQAAPAAGPSPAEAPAAGAILGLSQEHTDTGDTITITGDGKLDACTTRLLYDPPRLVLDFPDTSFPTTSTAYRAASSALKEIRVESSGAGTRLVLTMTGITGYPYTISFSGHRMRVAFDTRAGDDTMPVARIITPGADTSIQPGTVLCFAGSVTDGNPPLRTEWIVSGNGIRYATRHPEQVRFAEPGTYTVTYSVMDRDGDRAIDYTTVSVTRPQRETQGKRQPSASGQSLPGPNPGPCFRLSLAAGTFHAGAVDEFTIEETGDDGNRIFSVKEKDLYILALEPSYRCTDWLEMFCRLSGVLGDDQIDLVVVSAGPRIMLPGFLGIRPHLMAGLAYGHLGWSDAPGDFENALGREFGYGVGWNSAHWGIGLSLIYRDIGFTYDPPGGIDARSDSEKIRLTGYSGLMAVSYRF